MSELGRSNRDHRPHPQQKWYSILCPEENWNLSTQYGHCWYSKWGNIINTVSSLKLINWEVISIVLPKNIGTKTLRLKSDCIARNEAISLIPVLWSRAGRTLWVPGHSWIQTKTLSQRQKRKGGGGQTRRTPDYTTSKLSTQKIQQKPRRGPEDGSAG